MSKKIEYLLKVDECPDIKNTLSMAISKKFSGIISSNVSECIKTIAIDKEKPQCISRSPLVLSAWQFQEKMIPIIKLNSRLSSRESYIKENAEQDIMNRLALDIYLKAGGLIYIDPVDCDAATTGKFLQRVLSQRPFKDIKFVVQINLFDNVSSSEMYRRDLSDGELDVERDSWLFWNEILMNAGNTNQIEVALVINSNLPSDETAIYRWIGDSISMIVIPHNTFTTNKSNFPVMTKRHQNAVFKLLQYATNYVAIQPKSILDSQRIDLYMDYMIHLSSQLKYNEHWCERDHIRIPLQPLYDNLDNTTYEIFERDPAKYILYQRAIEVALVDIIPEEEKHTKKIVLMIVGCGRGPLIRAALNASQNTNRMIKILAVEKNPGPVNLLMSMIRDMWSDKDITLISKDMRYLQLEEKVDILVSELMGSFGDNELSPECLDGVQHLLKPTGISIPQNSKSYLQPVMNKTIYKQLVKNNHHDDESGTTSSRKKEYGVLTEVNWLSYMSSIFHIDEPKELFTFVHPNMTGASNKRYGKLLFDVPVNSSLHGFAGYFTSQLYKDIEISILPSTHTKGMASWYSMFFPISRPVQLKPGDKIEVEFWRKMDTKKVWYEWTLNKPNVLPLHNAQGIVHPIYL